MPITAEKSRARAIEVTEWVTATGVVLGVSGDLDAMACRVVEQQLRRLVARWPGLLLTLDLERVGRVDQAAAEQLLLGVVALRAGEARISCQVGWGGCRDLMAALGIRPDASQGRWPGDTWGTGHLLAGVTA